MRKSLLILAALAAHVRRLRAVGADDDPAAVAARAGGLRRDRGRRSRHALDRARSQHRRHGRAERRAKVRRVHGHRRARVPRRLGLRHRQRAEPRQLLVPDVQRERFDRVRRHLRGRARGELRRPQGRQSGHRCDRARRFTEGRRPSGLAAQHDLARPVHQGRRRCVPREPPHEADHGQRRAASLPEREHGSAGEGRRVAAGKRREPRPGSAGLLGRLQRDGPADVPGERRSNSRSDAVRALGPRRGGLADGYARPARVLRKREHAYRRRGHAGAVLQDGRSAFRVRPARRRAPLLPLDRRSRPRPHTERPRAREQGDEAGGERGEGRDRRRLHPCTGRVAAFDGGRRRERDVEAEGGVSLLREGVRGGDVHGNRDTEDGRLRPL